MNCWFVSGWGLSPHESHSHRQVGVASLFSLESPHISLSPEHALTATCMWVYVVRARPSQPGGNRLSWLCLGLVDLTVFTLQFTLYQDLLILKLSFNLNDAKILRYVNYGIRNCEQVPFCRSFSLLVFYTSLSNERSGPPFWLLHWVLGTPACLILRAL